MGKLLLTAALTATLTLGSLSIHAAPFSKDSGFSSSSAITWLVGSKPRDSIAPPNGQCWWCWIFSKHDTSWQVSDMPRREAPKGRPWWAIFF